MLVLPGPATLGRLVAFQKNVKQLGISKAPGIMVHRDTPFMLCAWHGKSVRE